MNKNTLAVLIVIAIGFIGIGIAKWSKPQLFDAFIKNTSDAASTKGKIRIGVDNWAGYFPLCSPKMKKAMRASEWQLVCEDDQANYNQRFKKLHDGELDFAVATIDAYLLNAAELMFPGVIVMVIDESKGGDAIVAYKKTVESIDQHGNTAYNLDGLKQKSDIKIAFTPSSPSEHLLKSAAMHFDITAFQRKNTKHASFIETKGSVEALQFLQNQQANVAILWEPDVSRALANPNIVKLLGTESTSKLIVDILIVRRDFAKQQPEVVDLLLSNYFRTLKSYRDTPKQLKLDFVAVTGIEENLVESMLNGVKWVNLTENCEKWFGISRMGRYADQGLIDAIDSTVQTLLDYGDFSNNPLPDDDAYKITLKSFVADLYHRGLQTTSFFQEKKSSNEVGSYIEDKFSLLTDVQWDLLKPMGTLKREPIRFSSGSNRLNEDDKLQLQVMVNRLQHYPNYRVLIKGHTGINGDNQANKELSHMRAEVVRQYLIVAYGLHPNRLRSLGLGGSEPLVRYDGESMRSYGYRLPRVELYLLTEVF
ncbi:MAG: phosphate ABC transporter substrate-binding/OmpA family protein [Mariprofundales bacterium]